VFGLGKLIRVRTTKQEFEVADVIRRFEAQYRARYPVTPEQARVMAALKVCRTAELGVRSISVKRVGSWTLSTAAVEIVIVRSAVSSKRRSGWRARKYCCYRSPTFT